MRRLVARDRELDIGFYAGRRDRRCGHDRTAYSPALTVGDPAQVAVSVATVWRSRTSPRAVDAPALARPARIRQWLSDMTLTQRRELNGRADTQALMGERVTVVRLRDGWAKVVVRDQPTPKDSRGYPGWVPTRQLTARPRPSTPKVVTVTQRTTWLRSDSAAATPLVEISFGTVLPVAGTAGDTVRVVTPLGTVRRIRVGAVVTHRPGKPALPQTRRNLVPTARLFTGLPYLWAGVSGFGLDCSGLTWLDYRSHGIVIPRDASAQAAHGTRVAWSSLRKGDLMFYATNGVVHHVTMYAGSGRMVEAPHTGSSVRTVPVTKVGFYGARRYLP
ncbi:C40 family peptidase [Nocardioides mesophilus]|uniref:C40 family peptidase n=1 Tax=Nocardioides mesophilus TaxID=433659 RepID=A0A7G9RA58_9ACTN|nr:C40 family peptidase [Nocardioides mesophilus]QNN52483.1 C40 family peptidase [Nocardioides mesophilus]